MRRFREWWAWVRVGRKGRALAVLAWDRDWTTTDVWLGDGDEEIRAAVGRMSGREWQRFCDYAQWLSREKGEID